MKHITLLISLIFSQLLHAQTFRNFNATRQTKNIVINKGKIWTGTSSGFVAAYSMDGYLINSYNVSNNEVTQFGNTNYGIGGITADKKGQIWAVSQNMIAMYNSKTWTFYDSKLDANLVYMNGIATDSVGNIWVGNQYGVLQYNGTTWKNYQSEINFKTPKYIFTTSKGNVWFATDAGVFMYDGNKWVSFTTKEGLVDNMVSGIAEDINGDIWFSTENGVSQYSGTVWKSYKLDNSNNAIQYLTSAFVDKQGNKWFGTRGSGVKRLNSTNTTWTIDYVVSGSGVVVNSFAKDPSTGNTWLGTDLGIYKYENSGYSNYGRFFDTGNPNIPVVDIAIDANDKKWVAATDYTTIFNELVWNFYHKFNKYTTSDAATLSIKKIALSTLGKKWVATNFGIYELSNTDFTISPYSITGVQAMIVDNQNQLWVGNANGLRKLVGSTFVTYNTSNGLPSNNIISLAKDNNNVLWIGTDKGLCKMDGSTFTSYTKGDGLYDNYCYALAIDKSNQIWIVVNGGLVKFDGKTFINYLPSNGAPTNITCIHIDKKGIKWLGTTNKGIVGFNDTKWQTFGISEGLIDNNINDIESDANGNVWIATNNGLSILDAASITLGISDTWLSNQNELIFSPNPVTDILTIRVGGNVEIKDLDGKIVFQSNFKAENNHIDISHLPVGLYIIKSKQDETLKTARFIKL